jgi:hypothetical protein
MASYRWFFSNIPIILLTLLFLACKPGSAIAASLPDFEPGVRLQDNNGPMRPGQLYSAVCVADWNEDGKKDLLVGGFFFGNIFLYLNSGTNQAPLFTTNTKLQADGTDLSVPYD